MGGLGWRGQRRALAGVVAAGAGYGLYRAVRDGMLTALHFRVASATGPLLRMLDAETAHLLGVWTAAAGLFPRETRADDSRLSVEVLGRRFPNPIGLAAGFDKDAECAAAMLRMGLGFVEVGSITPQPQPGNPKPRVFRLKEHRAVINRYGFNCKGMDAAQQRLQVFQDCRAGGDTALQAGVLGVNLGKNKLTEDAASDYCLGLQTLGHLADFIVINISSPNTPGLRALQGRWQLQELVTRVKKQRDSMDWSDHGRQPPPLLVKIAPDLTQSDKADIAAVVLAAQLDGIVATNTTVSRPEAIRDHPHCEETGGLSGEPLREMSTDVVRDMYRLTGGKVPIIGCGGVGSGRDAYAKIRAGASLVELYTAMVYNGPVLVPDMKAELLQCLEEDGFASIADAIGADHCEKARS